MFKIARRIRASWAATSSKRTAINAFKLIHRMLSVPVQPEPMSSINHVVRVHRNRASFYAQCDLIQSGVCNRVNPANNPCQPSPLLILCLESDDFDTPYACLCQGQSGVYATMSGTCGTRLILMKIHRFHSFSRSIDHFNHIGIDNYVVRCHDQSGPNHATV